MSNYTSRFPIGEFKKPAVITREHRIQWLEDLTAFPADLRAQVEHLSLEELELTYREGGWNVRQVVHHCADSHMNAITRFKLALTEDNPTIRPYEEAKWAELADGKEAPIEWSLQLLAGLHARLVLLLQTLSDEQLQRTFIHPDRAPVPVTIAEQIGIYAWHSNHHLAHVKQAKIRHELLVHSV